MDTVDPKPEQALSPPGPTCARCGVFLPPESSSQECAACRERREAETRAKALYPPGYIIVLGILFNLAIAGVLSALNWRSLGDRERARNAWIIAALGKSLRPSPAPRTDAS